MDPTTFIKQEHPIKQENPNKRQRTDSPPQQWSLIEESQRFASCYSPIHKSLLESTSQYSDPSVRVAIPIDYFLLDLGIFVLKNLQIKAKLKQDIKIQPCQFILADFIWKKLSKNTTHFEKIILKEKEVELLNFFLGHGIWRESGWCSSKLENKEVFRVEEVQLTFSMVNQKLLLVFLCDYLTPSGVSIKTQ